MRGQAERGSGRLWGSRLTGVAWALVTAMVAVTGNAAAQTRDTEHTLRLSDGQAGATATIEQMAWLAGNWSGEGFGDVFEAVWNPPSAGTMVGLFKLLDGDQVVFYELLLLVEEAGSLRLKVKHFHGDFTAWEEKDAFVSFPLVKLEPEAAHFGGLSFHRVGSDALHVYLALGSRDQRREELLIYRRR